MPRDICVSYVATSQPVDDGSDAQSSQGARGLPARSGGNPEVMDLLLLLLIVALIAFALGGPRFYRRRPAPVVYDDDPVVYDEYDAPVRRRRRFF